MLHAWIIKHFLKIKQQPYEIYKRLQINYNRDCCFWNAAQNLHCNSLIWIAFTMRNTFQRKFLISKIYLLNDFCLLTIRITSRMDNNIHSSIKTAFVWNRKCIKQMIMQKIALKGIMLYLPWQAVLWEFF